MDRGNLNLDSRKSPFFGLPFHRLTMEEAVAVIDGFIRSGAPHWITPASVTMIFWCRRNPVLRQMVAGSDLVLNDGMGLIYASRLLGRPLPENLGGPLIMERLMRHAAAQGYSVYFLGAKQEMLTRAIQNFQNKYPSLKVVGYHDGYFSSSKEPEIVEDIQGAQPDILLVAMGSPREEFFIYNHLQEMGVPLCLDVGGAFDVAAGMTQLAPKWVRMAGLEWFYRVMQEPRRLWKRYILAIPWFAFSVIWQVIHERLAPSKIKN